jgi:hypothetical protein
MRIPEKAVLSTIVLLVASSASAESFFSQFRDDDNWFDVSNFVLESSAGFMPVPILITEPAVGAGVGMAAVFFHAPEDYSPSDSDEFVLPDLTAVAGAITENGTWFVGGGHMAHWKDDRIRYEGAVGYASANLTFYGLSDGVQFDDGVAFEMEGFFTQHPISFRWKDSNFFYGISWDYYDLSSEFDLGLGIIGIPPLELDTRISGLDVTFLYDSLDNPFTPNSGIEAEISYGRKDDSIGSDFEFNDLEVDLHGFWKLGSKFVLGVRLDAEDMSGDVPFFLVPFIDLRGIPAMRYQGTSVLVAETEIRWSLHPRIGLVGFIGVGRAADSFSEMSDAPSRVTRGVGVRYAIARKMGMHVGIDVAKGPEDTHWLLTFGQAW